MSDSRKNSDDLAQLDQQALCERLSAALRRVTALETALQKVETIAGDINGNSTGRCADIGRVVRAALKPTPTQTTTPPADCA